MLVGPSIKLLRYDNLFCTLDYYYGLSLCYVVLFCSIVLSGYGPRTWSCCYLTLFCRGNDVDVGNYKD